jgi:hypothetical protein
MPAVLAARRRAGTLLGMRLAYQGELERVVEYVSTSPKVVDALAHQTQPSAVRAAGGPAPT